MFVQNVNGSRADITSGAALERGSSTSTDVDTRPETSAPGGVEKLLTTKRPSTALIASNVAVNVPDTSGATSTLVQSTSGDLGDGNSLFSCSISVRPRSPTTPRKKNHYHHLFFFFEVDQNNPLLTRGHFLIAGESIFFFEKNGSVFKHW